VREAALSRLRQPVAGRGHHRHQAKRFRAVHPPAVGESRLASTLLWFLFPPEKSKVRSVMSVFLIVLALLATQIGVQVNQTNINSGNVNNAISETGNVEQTAK
jgi:hypothetical protein